MLPPQLAEATESLKRDLGCALPPTLLIIALVFILPLTGSRPLGNLHVKNAVIADRRKFRSQTSDNMDRWKSRGGKSQRREEKKREDQRRERVRRKKIQAREKVGESRNTVFFQ